MSSDPEATGQHTDPKRPDEQTPVAPETVDARGETTSLPASPISDTVSRHAAAVPETDQTADFAAADAQQTGDFSYDADATAAFASTGERIPSTRNRVSIPGYRILGELGRGAMGVVYKAHQLRADRPVALKVMLHSDHAQSEEASRFLIEAQAAARLQHPNIVQIHEVGQAGETPYFTLEFVEGGTLARRMAKQMLSAKESAEMMLTLSQAMAYAHQRGVIHRDLKPANILVTKEGAPKIADFGLARRTDDISHLTIDGTILGTPNYMSPEQASGKQAEIGPLSDVYTLGAILYEMLIGRPPFKGASAWEVIQQVRTAEPTPPSTLQPGIARDLETICLKCLQPILARPIGSVERIIRLCKRYPREARLIGLVAALMMLMTVGAIATAYRINQDRERISQQRDEITVQRDEIAKEKSISDQRLTTYRDTVSPLANRIPNLLKDAPLGAGTRGEFIGLVQAILQDSEDTGAVGPSRQWGLEAMAIRQGELLLEQAVLDSKQSDKREDVAAKLGAAMEQFEKAEKIAQDVYNQQPADLGKAAANVAIAISYRAKVASELKRPLAEIAPLYKRAIELRREALTAGSGRDNAAERKAELGVQLFGYADWLLNQEGVDPVKFATRASETSQEASQLLREAVAVMPSDQHARQNARQDLGLALLMLGQSAERLGNDEQATNAYAESVAILHELVEEFPSRYSFRKLLVVVANKYGDYLLGKDGDPKQIELQYAMATRELKRTLGAPEIRDLQHGHNGLAMQFYRNGLVALLENKPNDARMAFGQCALLREMAWMDTLQEGGSELDLDRSITQRIELMLAKARSGHTPVALEHAQWLTQRAERLISEPGDHEGLAGGFPPNRLFLHAAAGFGLASEFLTDTQRSESIANALLAIRRSIETGFSDINHLQHDPDLAPLQRLPEYQQLIASTVSGK
jgi:eukaryotic-like serine/threonine-protein kinase